MSRYAARTEHWALLAIVLFRFANAFSLATFFQPDEFFQALEPAHNIVFGYGYITWEWHERLRLALHPLLYAAAYKAVRLVLSERATIDLAPKLVGALIASSIDVGTYRVAWYVTRDLRVARAALLMSLASAWNWYVLARSFLNNLETALTLAALAQWPWHGRSARNVFYACLWAGASCIVRPTNALVWLFLGGTVVCAHWKHPKTLFSFAVAALAAGILSLALAACSDRYFYGAWTFPLWNFVEFNVVRNLLVFYGSAPWHFYVGQGLPLMLMAYLPFFVCGSVRALNSGGALAKLSGAVLFVMATFLTIAHKEWRFLQPVYPAMLILAAAEVVRWRAWHWRRSLFCALAFHAVVAFFFSRVHERGALDLVVWARSDPTVQSLGLLTPCHSTPWHATMHRPDFVDSWFLTCEPPLHLATGNVENVRAYRDELDRFFDHPQQFLQHELGTPLRPWPSHLVVFEPHEKIVQDHVGPKYVMCRRFFNTYFHWDPRRAGDIVVFQLRDPASGTSSPQ